MAARRLAKNGKNVISPPPTNLPKKIFFYIFGGKKECPAVVLSQSDERAQVLEVCCSLLALFVSLHGQLSVFGVLIEAYLHRLNYQEASR